MRWYLLTLGLGTFISLNSQIIEFMSDQAEDRVDLVQSAFE